MIDTPWNDAQTERVFGEVRRSFAVPITQVIVTHAHDDNMGGLGAAHRLGAASYASDLTVELAKAAGKAVPQVSFAEELKLTAAGTSVELYYPGPGHALDNIVVYLSEWATLFGGCLIKAADAQSLGNTADADVPRWAGSVEAVAQRYPGAAVVVPGHGSPGGPSLLTHTIGLAKAAP
jgi:metallo-beta-lactamase class B